MILAQGRLSNSKRLNSRSLYVTEEYRVRKVLPLYTYLDLACSLEILLLSNAASLY